MKKSLFVAAIAAISLVACKKTENVNTTSADSAVVDSAATSAVATVDSTAAAAVDTVKAVADTAKAEVKAEAAKVK